MAGGAPLIPEEVERGERSIPGDTQIQEGIGKTDFAFKNLWSKQLQHYCEVLQMFVVTSPLKPLINTCLVDVDFRILESLNPLI